jgi:hypothetical protein
MPITRLKCARIEARRSPDKKRVPRIYNLNTARAGFAGDIEQLYRTSSVNLKNSVGLYCLRNHASARPDQKNVRDRELQRDNHRTSCGVNAAGDPWRCGMVRRRWRY